MSAVGQTNLTSSYKEMCTSCLQSKWTKAALLATGVALAIVGSIGLFAATPIGAAIGFAGCIAMLASGGLIAIGTLALLCKSFYNKKMPPLCQAALNGDVEEIKSLLNKGARLDVRDAQGRTPFMCAAKRQQSDAMEFLLKKRGVTFDDIDNKGMTPLMYLTAYVKGDICTLISQLYVEISKSGDFSIFLNTTDHEGNTALMHAVKSKGDLATIQFLLDFGAMKDTENKNGETAFTLAEGKEAILNLLKTHQYVRPTD